MKRMFILGMTVLILSMAFVGCDDGGGGVEVPNLTVAQVGGGSLTVTNMPDDFVGKGYYAFAFGDDYYGDNSLIAAESADNISSSGSFKGVPITSSAVQCNLFTPEGSSHPGGRGYYMTFVITNKQSIKWQEFFNALDSDKQPGWAIEAGEANVTFNNIAIATIDANYID